METSDKQGPSPVRARAGGGPPKQPILPPGTVVAGRYTLGQPVSQGAFGVSYEVSDAKSGLTLWARHVNPDLLAKAGVDRLKAELVAAAKVKHKNLVPVLDLTTEGDAVFVISEPARGETFRAFLDRHRTQGAAGLSLKSAVNLIAHLCNVLAASPPHGAITPSSVIIAPSGRVRLVDLGYARALRGFGAGLTDGERAYVAPEVLSGGDFGPAADLYSLGCMLFEALSGRLPGLKKLVELVPGAPAELDAPLERLLSRNPADRSTDVTKLKGFLWGVVDNRGASASQSIKASDVRAVAAVAAAPSQVRHSAARVAASGGAAERSEAPSVDESEEKWLVSKGKLDFGPYSFTQVRELIDKDDIQLGHVLIDNHSGMKMNVEDHPLLHDLVMRAAQRREDARRADVEAHVVKQDKRRGTAFFALLGAAILGVGIAAFFIVKAVGGGKKEKKNIEIAELERSELKSFKTGGARQITGGKKRAPRSGSSGSANPASDDALAFDMDDDSVGDERLDDNQINQVINANGASLARCVLDEAKRSGTRSADIEFSVAGSGKVTFVRVNGETKSPLASCVYKKMSSWRFPTFNGKRTRASFPISL